MTHLTLEQLLALREPGVEPGQAELRAHLRACVTCQAEAMRLDQRSARLRALPALRPARGRWTTVRQEITAARRRRRARWVTVAGVAMAAGFALLVALRQGHRGADAAELAMDSVIARSSQLEQLLQSYNPEARVTDGTTARVAGQLEDQIAVLDRQLELVQFDGDRRPGRQVLQLWRQRVGLLDALVDVHFTRARQVGF